MKYSVPKQLQPHIDFILPTLHFDLPPSREPASVIHFKRDNNHSVHKRNSTVPQPGRGNSPIDPKVGNKVGTPDKMATAAGLTNCDKQVTSLAHLSWFICKNKTDTIQ